MTEKKRKKGKVNQKIDHTGKPEGQDMSRGILKVEHLHFTDYRIHADFELSNGYRFSTDWEGTASLKTS